MGPTLSYLEELAREAGAILREGYNKEHQVNYKGVIDLVTEVDHQSEAFLLGRVQSDFPSHHIFSEESGVIHGDDEHIWYIDPLDGTTNYASNIPFFSVSIGLADRDMNPLVGVVYDPFGDQLFSAAKDFGATLNDKPLHISAAATLETAVLCAGFPYDSHTNPDNNLPEWNAFTKRARALRCMGSAALELSYVAAGRLDGFWEQRIHPWDVTAGIVIIREAGGVVTDYSGQVSERMLSGQQIVASNGLIHEQMVAVLHEARNGL